MKCECERSHFVANTRKRLVLITYINPRLLCSNIQITYFPRFVSGGARTRPDLEANLTSYTGNGKSPT